MAEAAFTAFRSTQSKMDKEQIGKIVISKTLRDWKSIETFADCLSAVAADMKKHATKSVYMLGDTIILSFPVKEVTDGGV